MTNPNQFLAAVEKVLAAAPCNYNNSPAHLLDLWEYFVDECREGYRWDVSEYDNEISVRDTLERLLTARDLEPFPELSAIGERVDELDNRFRALLDPIACRTNRAHWWEQGILARAGSAYASYIRDVYGIKVEIM